MTHTKEPWCRGKNEHSWVVEERTGNVIAMMPQPNEPGDTEYAETCNPSVIRDNQNLIINAPLMRRDEIDLITLHHSYINHEISQEELLRGLNVIVVKMKARIR